MNMENLANINEFGEVYGRFCKTIEDFDLLNDIKEIVFLFSGGKDATFGFYFMNKYIRENMPNIKLHALMVTYPTHVYYKKDKKKYDSFQRVINFWNNIGVSFEIFDSDKEDLNKESTDGCKTCKSIRKKIIDNYLSNITDKKNTAIVTGYTLYDVLAYLQEYSLVTNFSLKMDGYDKRTTGRVMNCLHKMNIKENLPNGFRIIRPLLVFKEDEIRNYLHNFNIPYVDTPCVVAPTKHKRAYFQSLNVVSHINNSNYSGVLTFLKKNHIEFPNSFEDIEYDNFFTDC